MSSADSALRSLGPHGPLLGAAEAAPQVGRAAPPARAPCTQQRWRILQHHWGPVSKPWQRQSLRPPFKGFFSWPVPWNPFSGTLALSSLPQPQTWKEASVPSRGKFISGVGAGHSSFHSLLAGVGVGVTRAPKENASIRRLWGPALSLTHVCLSSAPRCVWDLSACLARSLRPRESPEHRRLVPSAPGHAAAVTAELLAAVAPPVRRPEMPLPL